MVQRILADQARIVDGKEKKTVRLTEKNADEIIVLDKGVVVERGTHDELYAKGGFYSELISSD